MKAVATNRSHKHEPHDEVKLENLVPMETTSKGITLTELFQLLGSNGLGKIHEFSVDFIPNATIASKINVLHPRSGDVLMDYTFGDKEGDILGYDKAGFIRFRNAMLKETVDGNAVRSPQALVYAKRPMVPKHLPQVNTPSVTTPPATMGPLYFGMGVPATKIFNPNGFVQDWGTTKMLEYVAVMAEAAQHLIGGVAKTTWSNEDFIKLSKILAGERVARTGALQAILSFLAVHALVELDPMTDTEMREMLLTL